jgi:cbb3-type cytochrome oxidase subunit 3
MYAIMGELAASIGTASFFAFLAFCVWIDYRKKKDEREAAQQERTIALDRGFAPPDAEIERTKAYANAAWAAGLIGLLVPLGVLLLAGTVTIVAVLHHTPGESILVPLIVGWSIAGVVVLATVVASLKAIARLPRPMADAQTTPPGVEKRGGLSSTAFQEKRLEL